MTLRQIAAWALRLLAALACCVTLGSTIRSNQGWIRILDFPRLLELIAIALIAVGCGICLRRWRGPVLAALLMAAGYQMWRIWPYMPMAAQEVKQSYEANGADPRSCFSVLGLNVLQSNRDYGATIRMIDRERPDVLLLMETDPGWMQALRPVLVSYSFRLARPHDNFYGMIFASRLPVRSAKMVNMTDRDTPTLYAQLTARDGRAFGYIGLHPRPPLPGQDTAKRDAKIERAALAAGTQNLPTVAMGDFNDVAWSHTTQLFKKAGGFRDPRVGRGSYPTFPAGFGAVGWPLDQLFISSGFSFRSLGVLENVGSDHRPLRAELCLSKAPTPKADGEGTDSRAARADARRAVRSIR